MSLQQPAIFFNKPVAGAVQPKSFISKADAIRVRDARNARAVRKPGDFGSALWVIRRNGPYQCPTWQVVEARG